MACLFNGISDVPGAEFLGATIKFKGRSVVLRPRKKKYDARRVVENVDQNWNKVYGTKVFKVQNRWAPLDERPTVCQEGCRAGFKSWPDRHSLHSGSLNNWRKSAAFDMFQALR